MTSATPLELRRSDLAQVYRPQREWIEGRGILIVVAHFFSGVGAGAWLFSVLFDFPVGRILGLVCIGVFSGIAHLAFLGRWKRFWRILRRPHSSWISRGMWGIGLFVVGAVGSMLPGIAGTPLAYAFVALSLIATLVILLYEGFVYAASRAIPFWRTRLLPLLYIAYGLRGGAALLLVAAAFGGNGFDVETVEAVKLWVVVSTAVLILLYLVTGSRAGGAAKRSVRQLVAGSISPAFYGGTVLAGILIPIGFSLVHTLGGQGQWVLGLIGVASLVGDFYVKYCVVKAGVYVPLVGEGGLPGRQT
jgi:formate-dependent nitrite reductase membrane component NrfD